MEYLLIILLCNFSDSVNTLNKVEIKSWTFKNENLYVIQNSSFQQTTDLLKRNIAYNFRSYGAGQLQTFSSRASNASQTQLLWNDVPINNPMTSGSDLSLINPFIFNSIGFTQGASIAGAESASSGGLLNFSNTLTPETSIMINYSSMQNINAAGKFYLKHKKIAHQFIPFYTNAQNYFTYHNNFTDEYQKNKNAQFTQKGILHTSSFKDDYWQLNFNTWTQQTEREIPPTFVQKSSSAQQKDFSFRTNFDVTRKIKSIELMSNSSLKEEHLNFTDSVARIFSQSKWNTIFQKLGIRQRFNRLNYSLAANFLHQRIHTNNYSTSKYQNRISIYGDAQYFLPKAGLLFNFNFNQFLIDHKIQPLNLVASVKKSFNSYFNSGIKYTRFSRFPGMNDLYWNPGGNISLLPEEGDEYEIYFQLIYSSGNFNIKSNFSFFKRQTKQQIAWLPGDIYWSAQNIDQLNCKGLETQNEINYRLKSMLFKIYYNSSYNDARINNSINRPVYVPQFQQNAGLIMEYNKLEFIAENEYQSLRYTMTDNKSYLPSFILYNLFVNYKHSAKKAELCYRFTLRNLFNLQYQTIINRPMPTRNAEISLIINLKK